MGSVNNKQIAKNTFFLYIRMILIMAVSLYTSRVILKTLGVNDFGIYNLVAGFITLFSFISQALVSGIQRFMNAAMGENDMKRFQSVFSMSLNVMVIASIIIFLLGETLGYWFVLNQLNIPEARQSASIWVYQLSLITFIISIIRSPYNAAIIAYEKMNFYAYISIFEVVGRLGLVFLLVLIPYDKLIVYSILYLLLMLLVYITHYLFCKFKLYGCRYFFIKDKTLFKELVTFSGWSLLGQTAVVTAGQTDAIFVNRFFYVAANAALGVACQLTSAIETFVSNFQIAFNPQLVKSYVFNDKSEHYLLLFRSSKFSFFLQLILTLPIIFNIDFFLSLWLEEVPPMTGRFCFFIFCGYLFAAISVPLKMSIYANGDIKQYEISRSLLFGCGILFSFLGLYNGMPAYFVAIVGFAIQVILLLLRLFYANKVSGVDVLSFVKEVILPCGLVFIISSLLPYFSRNIIDAFYLNLFITVVNVFFVSIVVLAVGLTKEERRMISNVVKNRISKNESIE